MDGFDGEIERAVSRAGGTALGLNLVAVVLVGLTALAMTGLGNHGVSYIKAGPAIAAFVAAALLHGLARLVHLNAMQLMEVWRQGSRSDRRLGSGIVTTEKHLLVQAAARNNAEWCAAMSRSHGLEGEFGRQAWTAPSRTPPYYPDAVTRVPGADPDALVARIDTAAPGASIKDSFADLDLTSAGFQVLFEAQWIHRPAGAPATATDLSWEAAADPDAVRTWAIAWDSGEGNADLFHPELLEDPDTFLLAGLTPDYRVVAGAVASRSERVVGISNVFALEDGPESAWPVVLEAVHRLFPDLPVVGYEHGDALADAVRHGFEPIGPLRVWLHG